MAFQSEKRKTSEEKYLELQKQNAEYLEHIKFLTQELNISTEISDAVDDHNRHEWAICFFSPWQKHFFEFI